MLNDVSVPTDSFKIYDVHSGTQQEIADILQCAAEECDSFVVTGSKHGVYEDLPMNKVLPSFIADVFHQQGKNFVGICFGHQMVAHALGGVVEQASQGVGLGSYDYQLTEAGADFMQIDVGDMHAITLNAIHGDQVVALPDNAILLASNDFCPYAMMRYQSASGAQAFTVQPHPEFDKIFMTAYLENGVGTKWDAQQKDVAIADLQDDAQSHSRLIAQKMADILKR